jgi:hypothetical protein
MVIHSDNVPRTQKYLKLTKDASSTHSTVRRTSLLEYLESVFSTLPVFIRQWRIKTLGVNTSIWMTFCSRAVSFPNSDDGTLSTAGRGRQYYVLSQQKGKVSKRNKQK